MTRPSPHQYSAAIQRAHETRREAWPDTQALFESEGAPSRKPSEVAAYSQARWDMVEVVEDAVQTLPMMDTVEALDGLTDEICSRVENEAEKILAKLREERAIE